MGCAVSFHIGGVNARGGGAWGDSRGCDDGVRYELVSARDHLLTLFGFTDGLGAETAKMLPPRALTSLTPG